MSSVDELLNKRVHLPPIQGLVTEMPKVSINAPQPKQSLSNEDPEGDLSKSMPYTLQDDLSIFNVILKYYGDGFHGKIPWSFWQTYKRVTGSTRSNSSLYHHWNGAMRKKYESFIQTGRLKACVDWLETATHTGRSPQQYVPNQFQPTGMPLTHIHSTPPVPLLGNQIQFEQPSPLIRTNSTFGQPDFMFYPQMMQQRPPGM